MKVSFQGRLVDEAFRKSEIARINENWIRQHKYPHRFIQAASVHLYGLPLDEAIAKLDRAHIPHGNTAQASRRELARTIDNLEQIGSVLIDLWDEM